MKSKFVKSYKWMFGYAKAEGTVEANRAWKKYDNEGRKRIIDLYENHAMTAFWVD